MASNPVETQEKIRIVSRGGGSPSPRLVNASDQPTTKEQTKGNSANKVTEQQNNQNSNIHNVKGFGKIIVAVKLTRRTVAHIVMKDNFDAEREGVCYILAV